MRYKTNRNPSRMAKFCARLTCSAVRFILEFEALPRDRDSNSHLSYWALRTAESQLPLIAGIQTARSTEHSRWTQRWIVATRGAADVQALDISQQFPALTVASSRAKLTCRLKACYWLPGYNFFARFNDRKCCKRKCQVLRTWKNSSIFKNTDRLIPE